MTDKIITKEDVRDAVAEAIEDVLTKLGFDHENPREVQADMLHLRKLRQGTDLLTSRALIGIFSALGVALATVIVVGTRQIFGQ